MTQPQEQEQRARQPAGYMRGYASLFRAFPNDELWGRPGEAENAAQHMEEVRAILLTFANSGRLAPSGDVERVRDAVIAELVEEGRAKHRTLNDEQQDAADSEARAFYRKVIDRYRAALSAPSAGEGAVERPCMSAEEWKALPENARRYVMMLETECDPSGTIRSEMILRDHVDTLEKERVDTLWHCTACFTEFRYDGEKRPNCPTCKAWDQYTYRGPSSRLAALTTPTTGDTPATREEASPATCERCQGNGEIVTDWDRYKHPRPGDVGDEAVASCPDCDGEGNVATREEGREG